MASLTRTIRRKIAFAGMNKQQRLMWSAQHGGKNNPKFEGVREYIKKNNPKFEGAREYIKKNNTEKE